MSQSSTPPNGYERRKSRKRSQVMAAAKSLFQENGFSHVSVSQIAERAKVSPVTIYNHFGDKHGLVAETIRDITDRKIAEFSSMLSGPGEWLERLRAVVLDKTQMLGDFGGEFVETLYGEYPDLVRELLVKKSRVKETITFPFLDEGRTLGHIPATVSNEAISAWMEILARGMSDSSPAMATIAGRPDIFAQIYDLILFGLVRNHPQPERQQRSGPGVT